MAVKKTKKLLVARGEHPEEVDKLLDYEKFARKSSTRKVDFKMISLRFGQAERLIDLYEDLSKRSIDDESLNVFLSDSVTLLKVLHEFIKTDPIMLMALNEDTQVPFHHKDQGM